MSIEESLKRNMERLPRGIELYKRDPAQTTNNIRNVLAAFSQEDEALWETLRLIKRSRFFDEAVNLFGAGVESWPLDLLVRWAGTVRQTGWSNERLLREFDMDVYEQESWGQWEQIKKLMAHYFSERYPSSRVLTPEVEVTFSTDLASATFTTVPTTHTGDRVVKEEDILIFENKIPLRASNSDPRVFPYHVNGKPHTRYGIFSNIHFIGLPHEAIPKKVNNAFIPREAPLDGGGPAKLWNSVTNYKNGVGRGLVGVKETTPDLAEMQARAKAVSQGQVEVRVWAYGGLIPREAPPDGGGGKLWNSVTNKKHGVGGLVDGDVTALVE